MRIIVIVDMQNDFITGVLGSEQAVEAQKNIESLLPTLTSEDVIIFTQDTHPHKELYLASQEGTKLPVPHCIINTEGWEIPKSLIKAAETTGAYLDFVEKGQFGSIDELREMIDGYIEESIWDGDIEEEDEVTIEFCGVCTDICVVSNALITKAARPDNPMLVHKTCCAGTSQEAHDAAFKVMQSCQIDVVD